MVREVGSIGKPFFARQYEKTAEATDPSGFKETLKSVAERMGAIQEESGKAAEAVVAGNTIDSHDVMVAAQEASLAFDLILEVRNKLIEAYQEIIRMQI